MQSERFTVSQTPLPTAERVTRQRGALRWRIGSAVISLALLVVVVAMFGRGWPPVWGLSFVTLSIVSSALWVTASVVGLRNAKRDLARIPADTPAFHFDPVGIDVVYPAQTRVAWADVSALKLAGRNSGAGLALVVESRGAEVMNIPVSFLDATPAVIDSAAQAYSLGRVRLDTTALDAIL